MPRDWNRYLAGRLSKRCVRSATRFNVAPIPVNDNLRLRVLRRTRFRDHPFPGAAAGGNAPRDAAAAAGGNAAAAGGNAARHAAAAAEGDAAAAAGGNAAAAAGGDATPDAAAAGGNAARHAAAA